MLRPFPSFLATLALTGLAACGAGKGGEPQSTIARDRVAESPAGDALLQVPESPVEVRPTWADQSDLAFEAWAAELASGPTPTWNAASLDALTAGLERSGMDATRAAILLAYDPGQAATERLIATLERRHVAPTRGEDAGDIVAAAALELRPLTRDQRARLQELVVGQPHHPDLEVRIEIAAAALNAPEAQGMAPEPDQGVGAFLVRVLRAETPAQQDDPGDWKRTTNLAWAKSRSAQALNRALGLSLECRPDGSWAYQMEVAQEFADALSKSNGSDSPEGRNAGQ